MFKIKISYWRHGYSFIDYETTITITQIRHDEFPRFISVAFPYYTNVFGIMGANMFFVFAFLFTKFETAGKPAALPDQP